MAWDPDQSIPDSPLTKPERRDTRRVLKWYERREFIRQAAASWAKWLIGMPFAMLSLWQLVQLISAHVK
jgi:hypothetical protein